MGVTTTKTNKPLNPRGNDQSPLAYNRAKLYSGKALDFDGVNDQINITTTDLDFGANDFSVTAIVNWTGSYADGKLAYAEKNASGSQLASWQIRTDPSGSILFQANIDGLGWVAVTYDGVLDILAKGLTHLTFVRVGTGATLYINGQFYSNGTGSIGATLDTPNGDFCIGNRIGANNYWNGLVSNFKVFNVALTAAQVADLYNNPEKVVPTGVDNTALKLWLPMMEGAGTTAYDGSGNGNHGTISGATYVNGVGAPVAQSAVMDWNKGSNILDNSENFSAWNTNAGNTITSDSIAAPDGSTTADTISSPVSSQINQHQVVSPVTSGADYVFSVWLKKKTTSEIQIYLFSASGGSGFIGRASINFDSGNITDIDGTGATIEEYPNGWFRCAVYGTTDSTTLSHGIYTDAAGAADVYAWGAQGNAGATLTPYVPTIATAQTTPVLLPQGLTSGRDITGVNLFENVRKQGALNLDGNSWAEVHDNASLDIGDFSLEMWVNINEFTGTYQTFLAKGDDGVDRSYELYLESTEDKFGSNIFGTAVNFSTTNPVVKNWYHIVSTFDDSSNTWTAYINGSQNTTSIVAQAQNNTDAPIIIGAWQTKTQFTTHGQIAQPRIYNRALTAEEVLRNYNSGKNTYK